jgi:AAA15 family ATPase/GTPase
VRKSQICAFEYQNERFMLIQFTVGNFRSFKEPVTLSMVAAKIKSKEPLLDVENVFAVNEKLSLLKSAAVYGRPCAS